MQHQHPFYPEHLSYPFTPGHRLRGFRGYALIARATKTEPATARAARAYAITRASLGVRERETHEDGAEVREAKSGGKGVLLYTWRAKRVSVRKRGASPTGRARCNGARGAATIMAAELGMIR